MIKRIIDINEAAYVKTEDRQLLINNDGATVGRLPIEDLGVLILQNPAIVITQAAMIACQKNGVVVVLCDDRHLPYSILLPLSQGNSLHSKVIQSQIGVNVSTRKRLWKEVIQEKITQQALTLERLGKPHISLAVLAKAVKSGDSENREAQAAQQYWKVLFGKQFRRDANGGGVNALLNYGYSIVRAMVARAIVGSGLHPSIGIHHHNQYNGLCLADDLMEPFRPWVDQRVYGIGEFDNAVINKENKTVLLSLLSTPVVLDKKIMPLMVACHYLIASLKRAYEDRKVNLRYPRLAS